jgi:hypothetical protein
MLRVKRIGIIASVMIVVAVRMFETASASIVSALGIAGDRAEICILKPESYMLACLN